ncbi:MAG: hypothetical protein KJI71_03175 [Patescibacteria group bacterium]|nr:hypothetical protein [Patescibacteria group bacterium]
MYNSLLKKNEYIPGVCNIGPEEIKKRRQTGWIGLIATVALWMLFIWLDIPRIWRLALFFPAMMSAVGFLQAYMHFCAYFGFASLFNFTEIGKTQTIEQSEFHTKDRRKAWQIIIYSVLIGLTVSLIAYSRFS